MTPDRRHLLASMGAAAGAAEPIGRPADCLPDDQMTTVFTSTRNAREDRAQTAALLRAFARGGAELNAALVDETAGEAAAAAPSGSSPSCAPGWCR